MMERCRRCDAELVDGLAWCGRCQTLRAEPGPVYGQLSMPPPDPPELPPYEWSVRGFGPRLRVLITVALGLFVLWILLFWNLFFGIAAGAIAVVILRDVLGRHRWAR